MIKENKKYYLIIKLDKLLVELVEAMVQDMYNVLMVILGKELDMH